MKITKTILVQQPGLAAQLLAEQVPTLSKGRIKDAMNKGAVLWQRGKQQKRLRRAQSKIAAGEQLHLHYDDDILQRQCRAGCVYRGSAALQHLVQTAGDVIAGQ